MLNISLAGERFRFPKSRIEEVKNGLRKLVALCERPEADLRPWRDSMKDLIEKHGESGAAIRGARARDGLSQADLARELRTTPQVLSLLESGKRPVSRAMAKRLAKVFGVDYRAFL